MNLPFVTGVAAVAAWLGGVLLQKPWVTQFGCTFMIIALLMKIDDTIKGVKK